MKTLRENNCWSEDFKFVVSAKFLAECLISFSGSVANAADVFITFFTRQISTCVLVWHNYIYWQNIKYFLHKVRLHVSAHDNGHLQVVHEILIKQNIHGLYIWGKERVKWAWDFVSVRKVGRRRLHEGSVLLPSDV